jgi:putative spermidine/putrescine transport system ATP-binding protein
MVFQSYALFPHLTVAQNVAFGLKRRGVPRAAAADRVAQMIGLMKLDGLEGRLPAQLSGGQQQRVAVARALVISPEVVLLDEPFSNLDAQLRESTRLELRKIQRQLALTTIFVTHDQSEAMAMADRVAVMNQGRIVQVDTPDRIYSRPRNRFVASFVGHANIFRARVIEARGSETLVRADAFEAVLPVRAEGEVTIVLRPEAVALGEGVASEPNSARGMVESVSFLGPIARVVLRVGDASFIADIAGTRAALLQPGTALGVSWTSSAIWVLDD